MRIVLEGVDEEIYKGRDKKRYKSLVKESAL